MSWWQPLIDGIIVILIFLWGLLKEWIWLFLAPLKNWEILWIIIPIWINFIFTEVFQEKKGTGLGNAVTNGAILLWVGIDWIRFLIRQITENEEIFSWIIIGKLGLCLLVLALGGFIIWYGIQGKKYIALIGRVRETTYVTLMFSPIVYGVYDLTWQVILSMLIYFPFFYFAIEFLDKVTPTPKTYGGGGDDDISSLSSSSDSMDFSSSKSPSGSLDSFDPFESSGQPQNTKKNTSDDFKF
jgi:hypothetical protein